MQETQEMQVWFLGQEDSLEQEMATHSSILAWKIPWIDESGGLQSMVSQRVEHDLATEQQQPLILVLFSPSPMTSLMMLNTDGSPPDSWWQSIGNSSM